MNRPFQATGVDRPADRPRRHFLAPPLALLVAASLVACSSGAGDLGPVPTPATPAASANAGPTAEATPVAATPGATGAASGTPTPVPSASTLVATPDQTPVPVTPSATPAGTTTVRAYFLMPNRDGGDPHLVAVLRSVPATKAVATAAVTELLGGPTVGETGMATVIPSGTHLFGISIDGSTATVDLTGTFGTGGGSFSMLGRLAQLVYTVTQFSNVDTVKLRMDGQPVSVLGGEGIEIGNGMHRSDFLDYLPAISVDAPAWGGALPSGGHVTGQANVFEAQFVLRLLDANGKILLEKPVTASCGTGCWGTFDVSVAYSVTTAQWGTLRVFDPSAKDGSPQDVRDTRVWLTP
jgi:germination protein M